VNLTKLIEEIAKSLCLSKILEEEDPEESRLYEKRALLICEMVKAYQPGNPEVYEISAETRKQLGKFKKAYKEIEKSIALDPLNIHTREFVKEILSYIREKPTGNKAINYFFIQELRFSPN